MWLTLGADIHALVAWFGVGWLHWLVATVIEAELQKRRALRASGFGECVGSVHSLPHSLLPSSLGLAQTHQLEYAESRRSSAFLEAGCVG